MRIRAILLAPALAAMLLAVGASGASAATLFTSAAHTTRVAVGATASATLTAPLVWTSGATAINRCTHSTLHLTVAQNNDTAVVGNIVAGSFSPCNSPLTGNFATPWKLTITGTSTMVGAFTRWNAAIDNISYNQLGGTYSGNLTTGVTATQPTTAAAPICIHLATAGSVSGPLGSFNLDGSYCLSGTSTAFSLTN